MTFPFLEHVSAYWGSGHGRVSSTKLIRTRILPRLFCPARPTRGGTGSFRRSWSAGFAPGASLETDQGARIRLDWAGDDPAYWVVAERKRVFTCARGLSSACRSGSVPLRKPVGLLVMVPIKDTLMFCILSLPS